MANAKSKSLDRKKFLGDPILVIAILLIMLFLLLFIVYPLWTVTVHVFSNGMTQRLSMRPAPVQEVNQPENASYV
mgnify:CR=1 FL=1